MRDGGHRVAPVIDIRPDGLVMNEDLCLANIRTARESRADRSVRQRVARPHTPWTT